MRILLLFLTPFIVSCSSNEYCKEDFVLKGNKIAERSKARGTSMYFSLKSTIKRSGDTLTIIFYKPGGQQEEKRMPIDSVDCSDPNLVLLYYHEKVSPLSVGSPSTQDYIDWPMAIAIDREKNELITDYFSKGNMGSAVIGLED